jgi:hypothetical protein
MYVVGGGSSQLSPDAATLTVRSPADGASFAVDAAIDLTWSTVAAATLYRVDIAIKGETIHQAFVLPASPTYRLPPFVVEKAVGQVLSWRVVAMTGGGDGIPGEWRTIKISAAITSR